MSFVLLSPSSHSLLFVMFRGLPVSKGYLLFSSTTCIRGCSYVRFIFRVAIFKLFFEIDFCEILSEATISLLLNHCLYTFI